MLFTNWNIHIKIVISSKYNGEEIKRIRGILCRVQQNRIYLDNAAFRNKNRCNNVIEKTLKKQNNNTILLFFVFECRIIKIFFKKAYRTKEKVKDSSII